MNDFVLDLGKGWIAINKPPGLPSHATHLDEDDALSFTKRLLEENSDIAKTSAWDGFISCAHRLDRETSGVLLISVQKAMAPVLQNAFNPDAKTASKIYRAVLPGKLGATQGLWTFPISDKSEGRENPQGKSADRKSAETIFKVTRTNDHLTEIEVDLRTGRQHQIRKHAAIARHPVLGDLRYGEKKHAAMIARRFGFERMLLHAMKLELSLANLIISVTAPLPKEFDLVFGESIGASK